MIQESFVPGFECRLGEIGDSSTDLEKQEFERSLEAAFERSLEKLVHEKEMAEGPSQNGGGSHFRWQLHRKPRRCAKVPGQIQSSICSYQSDITCARTSSHHSRKDSCMIPYIIAW